MARRFGIAALLMLLAVGSTSPAGAGEAGSSAAAAHDSVGATPPTVDEVLAQADTLLARRGGARADSARLYLTWDAPYGFPRASRTHTPRSHDPQSVDTLWLCFLPGRTSHGFLAFSADLYFRAAPGDTLGPWWHMEGAGQNRGELTLEFGPDATFPQPQPWAVGGDGVARMYRTPGSARVRIIFAIPYTGAVPVNPDSVYTLCRVLLHHHRVLPGCSQPVCVEWASAQLSYWLKDEPTVNRGERFVSYAGDESICDGYRPMSVKESAAKPAPVRSRARSRRTGH